MTHAPTPPPSAAPADRMAWWRDAKFGIFIHWGPYAPLGARYQGKAIPWAGEWIRHAARIPRDAYAELALQWQPHPFDATA